MFRQIIINMVDSPGVHLSITRKYFVKVLNRMPISSPHGFVFHGSIYYINTIYTTREFKL